MEYQSQVLSNGLTLVHHYRKNNPMMSVHIAYNVGSRDEHKDRTGFAHLFEHLMFGGTKNVPNYDEFVDNAGGQNNAYTNTDQTHYYINLPCVNAETAFWLEADRMQNLDISQKALDVQKGVVIEEFKERYLTQPYGDMWLSLKPLCYKKHPYRWNTIGKNTQQIADASLEDVRAFFNKYYNPSNAILTTAGGLDFGTVVEYTEKWFGNIPSGEKNSNTYPKEPTQTETRLQVIEKEVPANVLVMAFHMGKYMDKSYPALDILSDILSGSYSSIFQTNLVLNDRIFNEISAFTLGSYSNGLFIIYGIMTDGISYKTAQNAVENELEKIKKGRFDQKLLTKCINAGIASFKYAMNTNSFRAETLSEAFLLNDMELLNYREAHYLNILKEDIQKESRLIFDRKNCSIIQYKKIDKS